jgi:hypothetical protein
LFIRLTPEGPHRCEADCLPSVLVVFFDCGLADAGLVGLGLAEADALDWEDLGLLVRFAMK